MQGGKTAMMQARTAYRWRTCDLDNLSDDVGLGSSRRGATSWLCHAQVPSCHDGMYPQRVQRVLLPVVHTVGPWHHSHGGASEGVGAVCRSRDATVTSTWVGVKRATGDGILSSLLLSQGGLPCRPHPSLDSADVIPRSSSRTKGRRY